MRRLVAIGLAALGSACAYNGVDIEGSETSDAVVACGEDELHDALRQRFSVVLEEPCGPLVNGDARCFYALRRQPLDHGSDELPGFDQTVRIIHRSCDAPTVISDRGYTAHREFYDGELADYFGANWVNVEHRFQGDSAPTNALDKLEHLTVDNAAADLHEIIASMRSLYRGRWVTTGASKGGITAIYHRFLYPEDVDGTVAYVAPLSFERKDARYQDHMDERVGSRECRQRVRHYQTSLATTRRQTVLDSLEHSYGFGSAEALEMLEITVARFEWWFWQTRGESQCAEVPAEADGDQRAIEFLEVGLWSEGGADWTQASVTALNYEWLTEHGFADQHGAHLDGLIELPSSMERRYIEAMAGHAPPAFEVSLNRAVEEWAPTADSVVLIYGEYDPWTGGRLPVPTVESSGLFSVAEANHRASISQLEPEARDRALELVESMMGRPALGEAMPTALVGEAIRRELDDQQWALR